MNALIISISNIIHEYVKPSFEGLYRKPRVTKRLKSCGPQTKIAGIGCDICGGSAERLALSPRHREEGGAGVSKISYGGRRLV